MFQQELLIRFGFGMATRDQGAPISGWQVDIDHPQCRELLQHGAGCQARGQRPQAVLEGNPQAVGETPRSMAKSRKSR